MPAVVDVHNDAYQTAADRTACETFLMTLTTAQLRKLADLNFVDDQGTKRRMVLDLVADRWDIGD